MSAAEGGLAQKILGAIREGTAPRPARLAAARGALPLERAELTLLQVLLALDEDTEISEASAASLGALGAEDALAIAESADAADEVQTWLASEASRWPAAGLALARRVDLALEALEPLSESDDPETLGALALNHRALAKSPALARRLEANPALPREAHARLLDYLDELAKQRPEPGTAEEDAHEAEAGQESEAAEYAEGPEAPAKDPFLASLGIDAELEAMLPELDIDIGALSERSELLGDLEEGDDGGLIARLAKMKVGQKLKLALFGTREERGLLVRDSNRIVATSVVKNPKFTETEAENVSNSRNVCEDVLRIIARHREFSKIYKIQHNLVRNPRCPADLAVRFIGGLREQDLKLLVRNRNVGDAVRRQAKKQIEIIQSRRRVRSPVKR